MTMDGFLYMLEKERQREYLREAECNRMTRLALESHPGRKPYRHLLARIGWQLSVWGTRLQERYGDMPPKPLILIRVER
jgi:hypothetical protein